MIKVSQRADFFVREKVLLTHNNNEFRMELSNAFDCVSQKEKILLNTENKSIIGVLTGLVYADDLQIYPIVLLF
jgi:hypothetical protein